MRRFPAPLICAALVSHLIAQPTPPPTSSWAPAAPALTAKATGHPSYGLVLTTSTGKQLVTSLAFDPATRKPHARIYRIDGPAGWGPFRSGLERGLSFLPAMPKPPDNALHWSWYRNYFYFAPPEKGSAAAEAGLDQSKYALTRIESVDDSNFLWDVTALVYHITQTPTIRVDTVKLPLLFGPTKRTFTIQNRRITQPPAPDDADLVNVPPNPEAQKLLSTPEPWRELLKLRSQTVAQTPLPLELQNQKLWAVFIPSQPGLPGALEIWRIDPSSGAFETGLSDIQPEPPQGFSPGQALQIAGAWYHLRTFGVDPAGRLAQLTLEPWKADFPALLAGGTLAGELNSVPGLPLRESLEQTANDALLEWKTLTLPGELASQDLHAAGALVVRLEKGVLALDLEVKGVRSRLDVAARAEAERKAQAELAAKDGKPAPAVLPPVAESERLADLLDQRKTILMAILGSAKQALANLRR